MNSILYLPVSAKLNMTIKIFKKINQTAIFLKLFISKTKQKKKKKQN